MERRDIEVQRPLLTSRRSEGAWIGYLQEHPAYWTQGETLMEHLKDLYRDITDGQKSTVTEVRSRAAPRVPQRPDDDLTLVIGVIEM